MTINRILCSIGLLLMVSCSQKSNTPMNVNKSPDQKTQNEYHKMSGILVEKEFIGKNGIGTGRMEYYFRASIQDYFIKICDSDVSKEELVPYLNKGITVMAQTLEGDWDICTEDDFNMQSRIGWHMIIKEIL